MYNAGFLTLINLFVLISIDVRKKKYLRIFKYLCHKEKQQK